MMVSCQSHRVINRLSERLGLTRPTVLVLFLGETMQQGKEVITRSRPKPKPKLKLYLPEEIELGEFTLVVERLEEPDATAISASFRQAVLEEFKKRQPIISLLYDVEIEEGVPWSGSRKSLNTVKLKRKKPKSLLGRLKDAGAVIMLSLSLLNMNWGIIDHNFHEALHIAEQVITTKAYKVRVEDINLYKVDTATYQHQTHDDDSGGSVS